VSSSHSAAEIQEDMLSFVNSSFVSLLRTMTSEQYRTFQHAVISRLEIPPISLYEAANEHWNEIEERRYSFQTKSDRLVVLRELQFEEVVAFYEKHFLEGSSRRMMAINCSPVAA
jgi:secreted Zn-dependent insulinase-like peptidase